MLYFTTLLRRFQLRVQGEKKSLSLTCCKIDLDLKFQSQNFCLFVLYSIYYKGKTIDRNLVVLLKSGKKILIIQHCRRVGSNSDFMILE